jgi:hypothetical protein
VKTIDIYGNTNNKLINKKCGINSEVLRVKAVTIAEAYGIII